jgi:subtilisin family serine protease
VNEADDNKYGWIYWSGTSFATPIISALAANVLARNPRLDPCSMPEQAASIPRRVQQELLKAARASRIGCPYLPVKQVTA